MHYACELLAIQGVDLDAVELVNQLPDHLILQLLRTP